MNISDFNISGQPIPEDVADKIVKHHLISLWELEKHVPFEVIISAKSGYRSYEWELKKGRKGNSQHCFFGKGAADITCSDFKLNKNALLDALIEHTSYSRFAIYNSFIHCDFAMQDERWIFNSRWQRIKQIE